MAQGQVRCPRCWTWFVPATAAQVASHLCPVCAPPQVERHEARRAVPEAEDALE